MTAQMRHRLTAITFSDSVFIATNYFFEATTLAVNIEHSMLSRRIPVRIGVAFGSFAALRFRSDVSPEGGDHAAQFLGSAVVRAYQAEKCGIKGMRILLHPSVEPLLADTAHNPDPVLNKQARPRPLECATTEQSNAIRVSYELDYWDLGTTKEADAWHALQDMWSLAPDGAKEHYLATAEAINRMRIAQGEASLKDLRRRTLPRRQRQK
jgi:hypothetical protein